MPRNEYEPVGASLTFLQRKDDLSDSEFDHTLKVLVEDGGGGPYVVISTERWAIDVDEIGRFADVLREAVGLVTPEVETKEGADPATRADPPIDPGIQGPSAAF